VHDSFSDNRYLYQRFSHETTETPSTFIGYSPTCVLAKLIALLPARSLSHRRRRDSRPPAVDFDRLNWTRRTITIRRAR
jgi:hypothetical protein